jgi:hypothetical protein
MSLKTVIAGLAVAGLIAASAAAPAYAMGGGGHGGGAGNWPQEGTWNYPVTCKWVSVQVKPFSHKHPNWQWVKQCQ